ncbi:4-phosphoerythronate dehydrogenase [Neptunomonas qingdaonensis]|uniref:Erythronate-4-phosphate dehydrogenase n=1 Tax=Neptunomonas qingdaonensis TaxID=1045558 RepID=A0A1I2Q487_9GAMM|nr:4-phosphoerythronate dehydrogenase [Neptunomonas qingdaonensis]SFG20656.1 erythronate-4-phosphate dehydrogenase [Neptunomonas qingdaonensis]
MLKNPLKIVADENIPALESMFGAGSASHIQIQRVAGREMSAAQLEDADVLLVRSITQVNQALLNNARRIKMVGTATIGTDHVDQAYLLDRGIPFFNAPGCNADAVVEYVLTVIHNILHDRKAVLKDLTVGIIGVGNVGGRLYERLRLLGVKLLINDPPRQHSEAPCAGEPKEQSKEQSGKKSFVDLQTVLQQSDIICMHTPLVKEGLWPTQHLVREEELMALKPGAVLINAGRGPVIDNQALLACLQQRDDLTVVLDVWENEPRLEPALVERTLIATPHIAGYSYDGKLRGTHMLRCRFAEVFGLAQPKPLADYLPQALIHRVAVTNDVAIHDLMNLVYDPFRDDRALRKTLSCHDQPQQFDLLRKNYPVRREFASMTVSGISDTDKANMLKNLGFTVELA